MNGAEPRSEAGIDDWYERGAEDWYERGAEDWYERGLRLRVGVAPAPGKPVTLGGRGPREEPAGYPAKENTGPISFSTNHSVTNGRSTASHGIGWAPVAPNVVNSCSVALRRMGDAGIGSIAVTSTSRGEGRTTVALGLAAAAATEHHLRTILVDLDLERGAMDQVPSVGPGPGVVDFLFERASIDDCLKRVEPQVEIVRAGVQHDPAAAMARIGRLAELITQLRNRCDVLIADLPPLSSGVTAARMADLFLSVALVVRVGGVDIPLIEQRAAVLTQRPFLILNGAMVQKPSRIRRFLKSNP